MALGDKLVHCLPVFGFVCTILRLFYFLLDFGALGSVLLVAVSQCRGQQPLYHFSNTALIKSAH